MDPITMIISALAAGAASAASDTAAQAVRDAYGGLKELLHRKFGPSDAGNTALAEHEKSPETWKAPLEQQLRAADAGSDEAIIEAAKRLLALEDPEGTRQGKYNVTVTGGQVGAIGDNANVHFSGGGNGAQS
jgi:hypothetical protein